MATPPISQLLLLFLILHQLLVHVGAHSGHDHDGDDESTADLGAKGLVLVKVYCLLIFLVSTFLGGVSPYFFRWNESFLLLGTQFAGGVFLGTSLMHFLPDANSTIQDLTPNEYPFVFMLASVGYLLTMLADVTIHLVTKRAAKGVKTVAATAVEEGRVKDTVTNVNGIPPSLVKANNLGDSILLILALCFHSVFEGIAVGVASTEADAWKNLWTILLHKIFAAIAMGIALLRMLPKSPFITTASYSFAFAISSPIGVGIGIGINATTQGVVADWIFVISMGIATGVFVYVAINHLIAKGYKPQGECYFNTPFFKFLAVTFGIGVIAVVMIWD